MVVEFLLLHSGIRAFIVIIANCGSLRCMCGRIPIEGLSSPKNIVQLDVDQSAKFFRLWPGYVESDLMTCFKGAKGICRIISMHC